MRQTMRQTMRHALAAAALALAGCDLLTAEIEVPNIGVTLPAQAFPASDTTDPLDWCDPTAPAPSVPPCIAKTLDYDLGAEVPALTNESVSYDLRLTAVTITLSATSAGTDLSGVRSAVVRVLDDPAILATGAVVASYTRPDPIPDPPPTSVSVAGNAGVDIGPYLDAGHLPFRAEIEIDSLTPAFDADVYAGFSLVISVDWGSYL